MSRRTSAVFSIEVPRGDVEDDDSAVECPLCSNAFCQEELCSRTETGLNCCDQPICCGCLYRQMMRCTCKDECDAIVVICPYCRGLSSVAAMEVFIGSKPVCSECAKADREEESAGVEDSGGHNDGGEASEAVTCGGRGDDDREPVAVEP